MTARRHRVRHAVLRRARVLEAPARAFRSRRGAIIAWLAIVLVAFGGSAIHALMHHSHGV
jgi:hypothetical protein